MAGPEQNGSAAPTPSLPDPKDERRLDLDAFAPVPTSRYAVRVGGVDYPVRQMMDLTGDEELQLAALDRAVEASTGSIAVRRSMFDRAFALVRLLVPDMPEKVRLGLKYVEALAVAGQAWAYAAQPNPPVAPADTDGAPGPDSNAPVASSRPASVDSSVSIPAR
jgi:hypothetical protein